MKKRYIIIAIALLIIINISALTTIGYNRYCQYRESCDCSKAATVCTNYLCEHLSLTDDQIASMETIRNSFILDMQSSNTTLRKKRLTLIELLNKTKPDLAAIDKICNEINTIQADLQKKVIQNLLKEKEILTAEQKDRYISIIKARILLDNHAVQADIQPMQLEDCNENCTSIQ